MIKNAKETLQWRRNKVLEAKENIRRYIDEKLPLEYQKCLVGLEAILSKTWDIANNADSAERDRLQAISVGMQAYNMKIDLLTNATVVERAVQFVEKYRSNKPLSAMPQNGKVRIDHNTTTIAASTKEITKSA